MKKMDQGLNKDDSFYHFEGDEELLMKMIRKELYNKSERDAAGKIYLKL